MFISKKIYNIVNPQVTKMTKYEKKLTVDILLKYLDIFCIILVPDFIFEGENRTKGKATMYKAIKIYANGKMFEASL